LFKPNEPYQSRGIHPSGKGIDRYIKNSDLTRDEKKYLKMQTYLSAINFISPQLIGFNRFKYISKGILWNTAFYHHLTPFGYAIDWNIFIIKEKVKLVFAFHYYANYVTAMPGFDVSLIRYPIKFFKKTIMLNGTLGLWLQPDGLKFVTKKLQPGALIGTGIDYPLSRNIEIFIEAELKTSGWVVGRLNLENGQEYILGVNIII